MTEQIAKIPWWRKIFDFRLPRRPKPVPGGIYPYRREAGGNVTRFHLRVDEDGSGLLLANASVAARLSASGVMIAKGLLDAKSPDQIRGEIGKQFRGVDESRLNEDLGKVGEFIETLANPEDNYPIFNLDDPSVGGPQKLMAPFHAQLPVADPDQINPVLQRLWDCGVAHVTFRMMKGSVPDHAARNIERAEDLGMISGLSSIAGWLLAPGLFDQIAAAGVDYVTVALAFPEEARQDFMLGPGDFSAAMAIFSDCKTREVCPVAEIPLFKDNLGEIEAILDVLGEQGVYNVVCYAIASEHQPAGLDRAEMIQAAAAVDAESRAANVRYVWLPAVSRPGNLTDLIEDGPRTAGDISIRVEPDGSVYPARGPKVAAGNLLADPWPAIWNHEVFKRYRGRVQAVTRCDICPGLEICAADCPGQPAGYASEESK
jgi:radical SAM protein with 4Fe4S-binding SPASM domain